MTVSGRPNNRKIKVDGCQKLAKKNCPRDNQQLKTGRKWFEIIRIYGAAIGRELVDRNGICHITGKLILVNCLIKNI